MNATTLSPNGQGRLDARWAVGLAALLTLAILFVFRDTVLDMYGIWMRSGTFTHCLLVLPISIWLLWDRRAALAVVGFRPTALPLVFLAGSAVLWLMGEAVSAAVITHFAVAFMIIAGVWTVWGHRAAWQALFPLAFLLFAVPFGEFLTPTLMTYTAKFTVLLVRASGVPVYQEGMSFVIPSGRWSVVEACSGIRYLIASLMVGVLFAYLNYRSAKRRALFVLASALVPLVANWLRAYMIVMLGHLSGNQLAVGADHLIYGWVFFGLVIGIVFWVGSIWREDEAPLPKADAFGTAGDGRLSARAMVLLAAAAFIIAAPPRVFAWLVDLPGARAYSVPLITPAATWQTAPLVSQAPWMAVFEGQRTSSVQAFRRGDETVFVQIAYFAAQSAGHELIQTGNRLVNSEDPLWTVIADTSVSLPVGKGQTGAFALAEIGGSRGRILALQTNWLGSTAPTNSARAAKLDLLQARLARQPDDSAAVVIWTPELVSQSAARATLERFVSDNWPAIEAALQATAVR